MGFCISARAGCFHCSLDVLPGDYRNAKLRWLDERIALAVLAHAVLVAGDVAGHGQPCRIEMGPACGVPGPGGFGVFREFPRVEPVAAPLAVSLAGNPGLGHLLTAAFCW